MTDIGYDTAGLRRGANRHRSCGDAITALVRSLAAIDVAAGPLGTVPSAAGFAAGAVAARDLQRRKAADEAVRRSDLARRASTTADLGDHLTSLTTAVAGSPPSPLLTVLPENGGG